ncbi:MAG: SH3 domain-containing protein [Alphaproteobacteria bacterium]|jgi:SH3-like domain-containing protein|nr:SH3 domain-containing protein [Alphaproteobacteria bacterium]
MFIRTAKIFLPALLLGFALALPGSPVAAQSATIDIRAPNPSGLPIPRWVSIRANEVNMRTGPGVRYPIDWVLQIQNLPVEVVGEFENWRKVSTQDKTAGWVHKSMLSGNRMSSVAVARARMMRKPNSDASITAYVEEGVVVSLDGCDPDWCRVAIASHGVKGWIPRAALWGLYPGEMFER